MFRYIIIALICALSLSKVDAAPTRGDSLPMDLNGLSMSPADTLFVQAMSLMSKADADRGEIFYLMKKSADNGNCRACGFTGQMLLQGDGINKDFNQALTYFYKGSKCQDLQSLFSLGFCFENGLGVEVNLDYAKSLYQTAAKKNFAPAKFSLALILLNEDPNSLEAIQLIEEAAKQRYKPAVDYYYQNLYQLNPNLLN